MKIFSTRQPISFKINEPSPIKLGPSRFEPVNTLQQRKLVLSFYTIFQFVIF